MWGIHLSSRRLVPPERTSRRYNRHAKKLQRCCFRRAIEILDVCVLDEQQHAVGIRRTISSLAEVDERTALCTLEGLEVHLKRWAGEGESVFHTCESPRISLALPPPTTLECGPELRRKNSTSLFSTAFFQKYRYFPLSTLNRASVQCFIFLSGAKKTCSALNSKGFYL